MDFHMNGFNYCLINYEQQNSKLCGPALVLLLILYHFNNTNTIRIGLIFFFQIKNRFNFRI